MLGPVDKFPADHPQQRPWFTGLRGELVRINTDQDPITLTRIPQPNKIQTYGMTVDPNGNPWMAGCSGPAPPRTAATEEPGYGVDLPPAETCSPTLTNGGSSGRNCR